MTKWFHACNKDWLCARQRFLTATDIKDLLPITKTGRKRTVSDDNYWKVMARKLVNITSDDCVSTGAAARGHILEPYAIDEFNFAEICPQKLHHWDDVIVARPRYQLFDLAFSPDATNVLSSCDDDRVTTITDINIISEVKSYYPEHHLICGHTPKEELEERWQIATAMAVCDGINEAYLLFYNPSMKDQLYIVNYDRADLSDEIEMILEIESDWIAWVNKLNKIDKHHTITGDPEEEQAIIRAIMKREELNPTSEKSIIR